MRRFGRQQSDCWQQKDLTGEHGPGVSSVCCAIILGMHAAGRHPHSESMASDTLSLSVMSNSADEMAHGNSTEQDTAGKLSLRCCALPLNLGMLALVCVVPGPVASVSWYSKDPPTTSKPMMLTGFSSSSLSISLQLGISRTNQHDIVMQKGVGC